MEVKWRYGNTCAGKERVEAVASTRTSSVKNSILRSPNRNWPSAGEKWVQLISS